jgi:cell division protein FtsL
VNWKIQAKRIRLGVLAMLPLAMLFPVHQAAVNREIEREMQELERTILRLGESTRILTAEQAQLASPDRIAYIAEHVLSMRKSGEDDYLVVIPQTEDGE